MHINSTIRFQLLTPNKVSAKHFYLTKDSNCLSETMLYPLCITAEILKCKFCLLCASHQFSTLRALSCQNFNQSHHPFTTCKLCHNDNTQKEIVHFFAPHSNLPTGRGCREEPPSPVFQCMLFFLDNRPDTEA